MHANTFLKNIFHIRISIKFAGLLFVKDFVFVILVKITDVPRPGEIVM
jgi:hypothetical protein